MGQFVLANLWLCYLPSLPELTVMIFTHAVIPGRDIRDTSRARGAVWGHTMNTIHRRDSWALVWRKQAALEVTVIEMK